MQHCSISATELYLSTRNSPNNATKQLSILRCYVIVYNNIICIYICFLDYCATVLFILHISANIGWGTNVLLYVEWLLRKL